jgi:hypothetical protein
MGFHDNVRLEKAYPEYSLAAGAVFQTKNLYQSSGDFIITEDGKLVQRLYRYEDDPDRRHPDLGSPLPKRVDLGEKVIDYHGDLLLWHSDADSRLQLVVRFAHGRLEWIRPFSDYPEDNRVLILEQGAR